MSCGRPKKKKSICEGVNWQLRNVNKCTAILSGGIYFGPQRQVLQSPSSPHSCNRNPVTKHGNKKWASAADSLSLLRHGLTSLCTNLIISLLSPVGSQLTSVKWMEFCGGSLKDGGWSWGTLGQASSQTIRHFEPVLSKLFTQQLRAWSLPASSHLSYSVTRTAIFS